MSNYVEIMFKELIPYLIINNSNLIPQNILNVITIIIKIAEFPRVMSLRDG